MRTLVRYAAFPVLLGTPVVLTAAGLGSGWREGPLVVGVLLGVAVPILVLQRLLPYREDWRGWHVDLVTDLLHAVFSMGLASAAAKAAVLGLAVATAGTLSTHLGTTVWPTTWPLLLQLPLALILGELGTYTLHRASHETPLLWRIHALHHSSERLYVLSSSRNHAFSTALAYALGTAPLVALGAAPELLALVAVFTGTHGMLQHANIDLHHGWLNHVFATADLHRWHHSAVMAESCSNYGSNLILWDQVFGTRFLPDDREVAEVGLGEPFPEGFVGHVLSPFTLDG